MEVNISNLNAILLQIMYYIKLADLKLVEEVSMNWIGRQSVTELEVSLNWMTFNMHFSKLLIQFHPVQ